MDPGFCSEIKEILCHPIHILNRHISRENYVSQKNVFIGRNGFLLRTQSSSYIRRQKSVRDKLNSDEFSKLVRNRRYACPYCDTVNKADAVLNEFEETAYDAHLQRYHGLQK